MKVGIIGAGAAGMLSAIVLAKADVQVTIIEQMDRVGKKILATGNGRCNMSNMSLEKEKYHSNQKDFAQMTLQNFNTEKTLEFFKQIGIYSKVEDKGKVYPYSNQASAVLDVLRYEMERRNVNIICEQKIVDIIQNNNVFILKTAKGEKYFFDKIIIATGGQATPKLGSDGSGYKLAVKLGHNLIETFPSLIQLKLEGNFLKGLKGIKFDGEVYIENDKEILKKEQGEILYTDYGISGPPVLQLSRIASEYLKHKKNIYISVDMFPDLSEEAVLALVKERIKTLSTKTIAEIFIGLINKKIIPILLKQAGVTDINSKAVNINEKEIQNIVEKLKKWKYKIIGTMGWGEAQVTAGGIDTAEINPCTMESKLVKNLYFAGEVVDVDGDCGGYNLQWAWSSGYIAAKAALGGIKIE